MHSTFSSCLYTGLNVLNIKDGCINVVRTRSANFHSMSAMVKKVKPDGYVCLTLSDRMGMYGINLFEHVWQFNCYKESPQGSVINHIPI